MKFFRALIGVLASVGLLSALLLVAPSAEAASGSVGIAAPAVAPALDASSKGTITTPKISTSGKAKITSRSYVIVKGRTTVASTSTVGKKIALPIGTYVVKVTVKYKVGKKKKTAAKSFVVKIVNSPRMTYAEYKLIKPGQTPAQVAAIVGGQGAVLVEGTTPCDDPSDATCVEVFEQIREWQTASANIYGLVLFQDGRVAEADYKYYGAYEEA